MYGEFLEYPTKSLEVVDHQGTANFTMRRIGPMGLKLEKTSLLQN